MSDAEIGISFSEIEFSLNDSRVGGIGFESPGGLRDVPGGLRDAPGGIKEKPVEDQLPPQPQEELSIPSESEDEIRVNDSDEEQRDTGPKRCCSNIKRSTMLLLLTIAIILGLGVGGGIALQKHTLAEPAIVYVQVPTTELPASEQDPTSEGGLAIAEVPIDVEEPAIAEVPTDVEEPAIAEVPTDEEEPAIVGVHSGLH